MQLLAASVAASLCTVAAAATLQWVLPGDQVPKDTIRITTLGSGTPDVRRQQVASGFLIELGGEEKLIFDLGSGAYINLLSTGVPHADLTKVFLTHLHSDHIADLATFYVGAMFGRTAPWHVWGPSGEDAATGTAHCIEGLRQFLNWDTVSRRRIDLIGRKDRGDQVVVHEFDFAKERQVVYDHKGVRVISTPVNHYRTDGPVALRLEWKGLSITYSGDTTVTNSLRELARGSDLLILQNMGPIADFDALSYESQLLLNTSHITPQEAGHLLSDLRPRLAVIHHLTLNDASRAAVVSDIRQNYPEGDIHLNEDLDVFEVSRQGIARRKRLTPDRSWGYWHADGAGVPGMSHPAAASAFEHPAAASTSNMPRALSLD